MIKTEPKKEAICGDQKAKLPPDEEIVVEKEHEDDPLDIALREDFMVVSDLMIDLVTDVEVPIEDPLEIEPEENPVEKEPLAKAVHDEDSTILIPFIVDSMLHRLLRVVIMHWISNPYDSNGAGRLKIQG